MPTTLRLGIPLLVVSQDHKEVTINDALNAFDAACVLLSEDNTFTHKVTINYAGAALTLGAGSNVVFDTATGTQIGTGTTQKLAFLGATPIAQQANTTDLRTAIINLGFVASGGATPLNLNGGALTAGAASLGATTVGGDLTISTHNIITDTSTGTQIGTGATQKLGFYGATTIVRPSSTTDLRAALINLGLYTTGGATPLDLNGGALTATGACSLGATTVGGDLTVSTHNIITDTTTGTKIGTGTTQKLAFYNSSPIAQQANTTDLRTAIINLGFVATGGATPLNLNGGTLTAADVVGSPIGRVIVFCSAFTPAGTGADTAEFVVPYSPRDGTTSITWNVRRIQFRVGTAGGAPQITIEKYTGTSTFSATTVGTVTLGSGAYEGSQTSSFTTSTLASGDKVRFNVNTLATATAWTVEMELGATS